jgi:DNA (cytosine-5)-methyltransferase 1
MKKQVHVRLDDHILETIKGIAGEQGISLQEYFRNALIQFSNEKHPGVLFQKEIRPENNLFTFIDLFAGIGGMRKAFEAVGGRCMFSSEYNKYAQETYLANFGEKPEGDITKINADDIPEHEILLAGFPCQPFSIAGVSKKNSLGKAHGFLDKTQGTLFFDVARIVEKKRPKSFLLENVKNLTTHDRGNTFKVIRETLEGIGYKIYTKVMDGRYFVPQHRERIFIIGMDRDVYGDEELFNFPALPETPPMAVKDIFEKKVDPKYTLTDNLWKYLQNYAEKHKKKGNGFGFGLVDPDGITRTLSARYFKDGSEILIPQKGRNPRRLTPRECARLQGYDDSFKIVVSDTQAYKQFGNSVVVPLIRAIAGQLIKAMGLESQIPIGILLNERLEEYIKENHDLAAPVR